MDLYPAIDLRGGIAVRLERGDFGREERFGDPLALARRFAAAGAGWIHVVDLDAARSGDPLNRSTVLAIAAGVEARVQSGGGVRSAKDAEDLVTGGVARVVMGTSAITDPALVRTLAERFPGQIAVGLDHRGGGSDVAIDGWQSSSGTSLHQALHGLEDVDVAAVVVTTIERDGVMAGPDLQGLSEVLRSTRHRVIASGGVRSADDLRRLADLAEGDRRLEGAIVGRALVDGSLDLEEALAACAASG